MHLFENVFHDSHMFWRASIPSLLIEHHVQFGSYRVPLGDSDGEKASSIKGSWQDWLVFKYGFILIIAITKDRWCASDWEVTFVDNWWVKSYLFYFHVRLGIASAIWASEWANSDRLDADSRPGVPKVSEFEVYFFQFWLSDILERN